MDPQRLSFIQLLERFKADKIIFGYEQCKWNLKWKCTNDENVIAKIYPLLLKYKTEEQVKEFMIKWTKTLLINCKWVSVGKNVVERI